MCQPYVESATALSNIIYIIICMSSIAYGKTIQKNGLLNCVGEKTYSKHKHAQKSVLGV